MLADPVIRTSCQTFIIHCTYMILVAVFTKCVEHLAPVTTSPSLTSPLLFLLIPPFLLPPSTFLHYPSVLPSSPLLTPPSSLHLPPPLMSSASKLEEVPEKIPLQDKTEFQEVEVDMQLAGVVHDSEDEDFELPPEVDVRKKKSKLTEYQVNFIPPSHAPHTCILTPPSYAVINSTQLSFPPHPL